MLRTDTNHATKLRKTLALVLAGNNGRGLAGLEHGRVEPAVPFGGHHRVIDFTLSNCVNSHIDRIAVLTHDEDDPVVEHIAQNWHRSGTRLGNRVEIWPARTEAGGCRGTAEAIFRNRDRIMAYDPDDVLIVPGEHVYTMDYSKLCGSHASRIADVTIGCVEVPASRSHSHGIVEVDDEQRIRAFIERADWPVVAARSGDLVLASMGVCLFNADCLLECLDADARDADSRHEFVDSVMPYVLANADVYAHTVRSDDGRAVYWRDLGSVDRYWRAHQELIDGRANLDMASPDWPILGCRRQGTPARLLAQSRVTSSLIGSDSTVAGAVERSVVSTGSAIGEGSSVTGSVLLPHAEVGRNCRLESVIVDSHCRIPDNTVVCAKTAGRDGRFHVSPRGIVLVTAEALAQRVVRREAEAFEDELRERRIA